MTRDELQGKMNEVVALLKREQQLRVEITALDLGPSRRDALIKNLERHDAILDEINDLRQRQMMPIFRDLAQFIQAAGALQANHTASESGR